MCLPSQPTDKEGDIELYALRSTPYFLPYKLACAKWPPTNFIAYIYLPALSYSDQALRLKSLQLCGLAAPSGRRALILIAHASGIRRLTYLFLVTGALKYEGAEKAAAYASDAKKEALAARAALEEVASAAGVVLPAPKARELAAASSS